MYSDCAILYTASRTYVFAHFITVSMGESYSFVMQDQAELVGIKEDFHPVPGRCSNCHKLNVPPQFDFFASLISNKFCEKPNLPSTHCNMLARLQVCSFFVKSSLLNYLMLVQALGETKIEMLKNQDFHSW